MEKSRESSKKVKLTTQAHSSFGKKCQFFMDNFSFEFLVWILGEEQVEEVAGEQERMG